MDLAVDRLRHSRRTARADGESPASTVMRSPYFNWKDYFGRCLALTLLVIGVPIMLLAVVLVRLTSRGRAIYRQQRVGLNGRNFTMYKIRTMRLDAEASTGPVWTRTRDPRITPIGRVMRRLHIDEFPQLLNVLRGEMSLIGPRPERPEFTQILARQLPGYMDRLLVRPGITGLAQLNLPPDTDLDSVRRKLVLDLEYVELGNLSLDLRILAATSLRLFAVSNAFSLRIFGLLRRSSLDLRRAAPFELMPDETIAGQAMEALSR